jgi:hypothetical protein
MFLPVSESVAEGNMLRQRDLPYRVAPNFIPDEPGAERYDDHPSAQRYRSETSFSSQEISPETRASTCSLQPTANSIKRPPCVDRTSSAVLEDLPPGVVTLDVVPRAAVMSAWQRAVSSGRSVRCA